MATSFWTNQTELDHIKMFPVENGYMIECDGKFYIAKDKRQAFRLISDLLESMEG